MCIGGAEFLVERSTRVLFQLVAKVVSDARVGPRLDGPNAFEKRRTATDRRGYLFFFVFADLVRIAELRKELRRIVETVDAKIETVDIAVIEPEPRVFAGAVSVSGSEREERLDRFGGGRGRHLDRRCFGGVTQSPLSQRNGGNNDHQINQNHCQTVSVKTEAEHFHPFKPFTSKRSTSELRFGQLLSCGRAAAELRFGQLL